VTVRVGDGLQETLSCPVATLSWTTAGGSGGGSTITRLSLSEPLAPLTVILANAAPADTDNVVASCPELLVKPLVTLKVPRPLGSVLLNDTGAFAATAPPSNTVAVIVVLPPGAMSV
jgi:hypothetical protein